MHFSKIVKLEAILSPPCWHPIAETTLHPAPNASPWLSALELIQLLYWVTQVFITEKASLPMYWKLSVASTVSLVISLQRVVIRVRSP